MDISRPTWLEVDLDKISYNIENIRKFVKKDRSLMAVVKADAYGLGAVEVARLLEEQGVDYLAVANLIEALELRRASIKIPILVLGFTDSRDFGHLIGHDIMPTIYNYSQAQELDRLAGAAGVRTKIHLKLDTGMSRLGFLHNSQSLEEILALSRLEHLEIDGVYSHFIDAENRDKSLCHLQYKRFISFVDEIESYAVDLGKKHLSNSGALIDLEEYGLDMVRPGIILYGIYPENVDRTKLDLKFSMELKSQLGDFKYIEKGEYVGYGQGFRADKRLLVGTMPLGYGHGYRQEMAQLVDPSYGSKKLRVIGRVCMDQTILDLSQLRPEELELGGEISVLYPDENIDIGWFSSLTRRVPIVYKKGDRPVKTVNYLL